MRRLAVINVHVCMNVYTVQSSFNFACMGCITTQYFAIAFYIVAPSVVYQSNDMRGTTLHHGNISVSLFYTCKY